MSIYKSEFPIATDILHFNHAGIGPWPQRTVQAIYQFANENARSGSLYYSEWHKRLVKLRHQCAELIGADTSEEIAFTKNTSDGLSIIAGGIDWKTGENIILSEAEFPSNRIAWEAFAQRFGVEIRLVPSPSTNISLEDAMIAQIDGRTRLLTTSSVQYTTGYRMDLVKLGLACQKNQVLFCVDAIQSLGAVPFCATDYNADFVCADGHKWLLSPEGTGLFYCKKKHLEMLRLNQFGWHMVENAGDYAQKNWTAAPDATRFECGSMNHLGLFALAASLELLFEVGLNNIYRKVMRNVTYLFENIDRSLYTVLTPESPSQRAGIITIRPISVENDAIYRHLLASNVLCAKRVGGIRLSPHFYTSERDMQEVLKHLHYGAR